MVVFDCGVRFVLFSGVAPAKAGRASLNKPVLLGRGQKAEIQRRKTVAEGVFFLFL
jgi:hypothetical protein